MTELEKLMKRLERLDAELIKNRDFLAKTNSMCFDAKTKEDVTACINSKLDLINWIREQNEEILADTQHDKERESNMGIWDKTVLSVGITINHLANAMMMTSNLQADPDLAARRKETQKLMGACHYFMGAMQAINEQTYKYTTEEEKENDGNK